MKNNKAKITAFFGLMVALAFTLSFLESLIPFHFGIPGVKLGLANIVIVVTLYTSKPSEAFLIALIRIILAGLTFGNMNSFIYSLCGGILSYILMLAAKRTKLSTVGVSILGGISHNIGQILAAAVLMNTVRIAYYLPVLLISGMVTGMLLGIAAKPIINRLNTIKNKNGEIK